jgi:hypothetical protein
MASVIANPPHENLLFISPHPNKHYRFMSYKDVTCKYFWDFLFKIIFAVHLLLNDTFI